MVPTSPQAQRTPGSSPARAAPFTPLRSSSLFSMALASASPPRLPRSSLFFGDGLASRGGSAFDFPGLSENSLQNLSIPEGIMNNSMPGPGAEMGFGLGLALGIYMPDPGHASIKTDSTRFVWTDELEGERLRNSAKRSIGFGFTQSLSRAGEIWGWMGTGATDVDFRRLPPNSEFTDQMPSARFRKLAYCIVQKRHISTPFTKYTSLIASEAVSECKSSASYDNYNGNIFKNGSSGFLFADSLPYVESDDGPARVLCNNQDVDLYISYRATESECALARISWGLMAVCDSVRALVGKVICKCDGKMEDGKYRTKRRKYSFSSIAAASASGSADLENESVDKTGVIVRGVNIKVETLIASILRDPSLVENAELRGVLRDAALVLYTISPDLKFGLEDSDDPIEEATGRKSLYALFRDTT